MALSAFSTPGQIGGRDIDLERVDWRTQKGIAEHTKLTRGADGEWMVHTRTLPVGQRIVLDTGHIEYGFIQRLKGNSKAIFEPWQPGRKPSVPPADMVQPEEALRVRSLFQDIGIVPMVFLRTIALNAAMDFLVKLAQSPEAEDDTKRPLVLLDTPKTVTVKAHPGEPNYAPRFELLAWVDASKVGFGPRITGLLSPLRKVQAIEPPRPPDSVLSQQVQLPANDAGGTQPGIAAAAVDVPWDTPEPAPLPPAANTDEPGAHDPFEVFRRR